jgi:hypothetical protein
MDLNNQNNSLPPTSQDLPQTKKWYQHKGLISIAVLAVIAGVAVWAYFALNQTQNLSSVKVNHKPTVTATNQGSTTTPSLSTATSSPIDTGNWQTYSNNQYGFSFKYPTSLSEYKNQYSIFTIQSTPKQLVFGEGFGAKGTEGVDFVTQGFQFNLVGLKSRSDFKNGLQDSTYDITKLKLSNIQATRYDDTGGVTRGPVVAIEDPNSPSEYVLFNYAAQCDDGVIDGQQCTIDQVEKLFNQILSTFKFVNHVTGLSIPKCGISASANSNNPIDPQLVEAISSANQNVIAKINSGYKIEQACDSANKGLLFFDFATGYWNNATSVSDSQLNKKAEQVILGISDPNFKNVALYPINISGYRLEGEGGMACNFDSSVNGQILYICDDAADSGDNETWYAYNIQSQTNVKVKHTFVDFTPDAPPSSNQSQTYRADLLSLFTVQK